MASFLCWPHHFLFHRASLHVIYTIFSFTSQLPVLASLFSVSHGQLPVLATPFSLSQGQLPALAIPFSLSQGQFTCYLHHFLFHRPAPCVGHTIFSFTGPVYMLSTPFSLSQASSLCWPLYFLFHRASFLCWPHPFSLSQGQLPALAIPFSLSQGQFTCYLHLHHFLFHRPLPVLASLFSVSQGQLPVLVIPFSLSQGQLPTLATPFSLSQGQFQALSTPFLFTGPAPCVGHTIFSWVTLLLFYRNNPHTGGLRVRHGQSRRQPSWHQGPIWLLPELWLRVLLTTAQHLESFQGLKGENWYTGSLWPDVLAEHALTVVHCAWKHCCGLDISHQGIAPTTVADLFFVF